MNDESLHRNYLLKKKNHYIGIKTYLAMTKHVNEIPSFENVIFNIKDTNTRDKAKTKQSSLHWKVK